LKSQRYIFRENFKSTLNCFSLVALSYPLGCVGGSCILSVYSVIPLAMLIIGKSYMLMYYLFDSIIFVIITDSNASTINSTWLCTHPDPKHWLGVEGGRL